MGRILDTPHPKDKRVLFQIFSTPVEPFEYAVRPTTLYLWGVCAIRPKNKNTYIA